MTLEPQPTPLDRRVLDALPAERPGLRVEDVARAVSRREWYWQARSADVERARELRAADVEDVRRTLRGFEHLGHTTGRGGWWRRTHTTHTED